MNEKWVVDSIHGIISGQSFPKCSKDSFGVCKAGNGIDVSADGTISVNVPVYKVTIVENVHATITLSAVAALEGGTITATITAATNYHLTDLKVDGESVGALASYTFSNISADHTIEAVTAENPIITVIQPTSGGTISPETCHVTPGGSATFSITGNYGYNLKNIKVDGSTLPAATSYTFTNVTTDHTITAEFEEAVIYSFKVTPANQTSTAAGVWNNGTGGAAAVDALTGVGVSDFSASDGSNMSTYAARAAIYTKYCKPYVVPRNDFANEMAMLESDWSKKADGTTPTIDWTTNDFFRGCDLIYLKITGTVDQYTVQFVNAPMDETDGWFTWHKLNSGTTKRLYLGVFNGTVTNSKLQSAYNTTTPGNTASNDTFATYAQNCGTTYNTCIWITRCLWNMWAMWVYGTLNIENVVKGYLTGGSSASSLHNAQSNFSMTGGITQGGTGNTDATILGIKNYHGHMWQMLNGITQTSGTLRVQTKQDDRGKVTSVPSSWETITGLVSSTGLSESYIKKVSIDKRAFSFPTETGGSSSTYYADAIWSASGTMQVLAGGNCHCGSACGVFAAYVGDAGGWSGNWNCGARLQAYKPVA